jgi:hypothetical protein
MKPTNLEFLGPQFESGACAEIVAVVDSHEPAEFAGDVSSSEIRFDNASRTNTALSDRSDRRR